MKPRRTRNKRRTSELKSVGLARALQIVLKEGKNRYIRRLLEHLQIEVLRLVRVAIGPLALGDPPKRATRALEPEEKRAMNRAMRGANRLADFD